MTTFQELRKLPPASLLSQIRACGAQLWSEADIEVYKKEEIRRQRGYVYNTLLRLHPTPPATLCVALLVFSICSLFAAIGMFAFESELGFAPAFCGMAGLFALHWLASKDLEWRSLSVPYYIGALPAEAHLLMKNIGRMIPHAEFRVEFLGQDPILWMYIPLGFSRFEVGRYAVLVWDDNGAIVPPPN